MVEVCKSFFCSTLSLKEWQVHAWAKKKFLLLNDNMDENLENLNSDEEVVDDMSEDEITEQISERRQFLLNWFELPPKLLSHYCRRESNKLYLEGNWQSKVQLYEVYKSYATEKNEPFVSRTYFCNLFEELDLSLYLPKKDQCDTCVGHKVGNVEQEADERHILEKDRARMEKEVDKNLALQNKIICLAVDMEAVKASPLTKSSAMYYCTKLLTHNYTVFNLSNRNCMCYWFNETEADLSANTYASCLSDFLTTNCISEDKKRVTIYSDNCCNQNKNQVVANPLLHNSIKLGIEITQKYLEKGHTQMECDSVHAAIERRLKI